MTVDDNWSDVGIGAAGDIELSHVCRGGCRNGGIFSAEGRSLY